MQKIRVNRKLEPTKIKPILEESLVKSFENVSINSSYTTSTYHEEVGILFWMVNCSELIFILLIRKKIILIMMMSF